MNRALAAFGFDLRLWGKVAGDCQLLNHRMFRRYRLLAQ
jgi:hypothetical protein